MHRLTDELKALLRHRDGVAAIEFAFVFPVMLLISVGALDLGLLMFDFHNASEATRRGVREAVIQRPIVNYSDIVAAASTCTSSGGTVSCTSGTIDDSAVFTAIYDAMQVILPRLTEDDIVVTYDDSDITSGDVVTPTVTVKIRNVTYDSLVTGLVPGLSDTWKLGSFRATRVMSTSF